MKRLLPLIILSLILLGCTANNISGNPEQNPKWIKALIGEIEGKPLGTSPPAIERCSYHDKIVYHIIAPCCDDYNYLYDENNKVICAPDGGITGRGDEKCPDFSAVKKSCEVIWQQKTSNKRTASTTDEKYCEINSDCGINYNVKYNGSCSAGCFNNRAQVDKECNERKWELIGYGCICQKNQCVRDDR